MYLNKFKDKQNFIIYKLYTVPKFNEIASGYFIEFRTAMFLETSIYAPVNRVTRLPARECFIATELRFTAQPYRLQHWI